MLIKTQEIWYWDIYTYMCTYVLTIVLSSDEVLQIISLKSIFFQKSSLSNIFLKSEYERRLFHEFQIEKTQLLINSYMRTQMPQSLLTEINIIDTTNLFNKTKIRERERESCHKIIIKQWSVLAISSEKQRLIYSWKEQCRAWEMRNLLRGNLGSARLKVDVEMGRIGLDDLAIVTVHRLSCLYFSHNFFFSHLAAPAGGITSLLVGLPIAFKSIQLSGSI